MRASKLGPPGKAPFLGKRPTWEPMEAKSGPVEVMTLPTSLRRDIPENYSGQGKDQDAEDVNAARVASGEEKEMEGSGEGSNFPDGFGLKANKTSLSQTEAATVAEHTTLFHWQLVPRPPPHLQTQQRRPGERSSTSTGPLTTSPLLLHEEEKAVQIQVSLLYLQRTAKKPA